MATKIKLNGVDIDNVLNRLEYNNNPLTGNVYKWNGCLKADNFFKYKNESGQIIGQVPPLPTVVPFRYISDNFVLTNKPTQGIGRYFPKDKRNSFLKSDNRSAIQINGVDKSYLAKGYAHSGFAKKLVNTPGNYQLKFQKINDKVGLHLLDLSTGTTEYLGDSRCDRVYTIALQGAGGGGGGHPASVSASGGEGGASGAFCLFHMIFTEEAFNIIKNQSYAQIIWDLKVGAGGAGAPVPALEVNGSNGEDTFIKFNTSSNFTNIKWRSSHIIKAGGGMGGHYYKDPTPASHGGNYQISIPTEDPYCNIIRDNDLSLFKQGKDGGSPGSVDVDPTRGEGFAKTKIPNFTVGEDIGNYSFTDGVLIPWGYEVGPIQGTSPSDYGGGGGASLFPWGGTGGVGESYIVGSSQNTPATNGDKGYFICLI